MDRYITVEIKNVESASWDIGKTVMFKKDENCEQIGAYMPIVGQVGLVANDRELMVKGTQSAARIYDCVSAVFHGRIMFVLGDKAIIKLIIEERKKEIQLFDIGAMRQTATRM